jgi:predicted negative regulator of RcsB-dependent stress response
MASTAPGTGKVSELDGDTIKDWFATRGKMISTVAIGAVGLILVGYFVRENGLRKNENADRALVTAQSAFYAGNATLAKSDLEKLVTRWPKTPAGAQAAMLLAQILYGEGKYDDGISRLTAVIGSAPADFAASVEDLIAAGYADSKRYPEAIDHLTKAAEKARFAADKAIYQADAARLMTLAGRSADARKAWEALANDPESPVGAEAKVRLGELDAKASPK